MNPVAYVIMPRVHQHEAQFCYVRVFNQATQASMASAAMQIHDELTLAPLPGKKSKHGLRLICINRRWAMSPSAQLALGHLEFVLNTDAHEPVDTEHVPGLTELLADYGFA
mgnify:CR=1 FL=1